MRVSSRLTITARRAMAGLVRDGLEFVAQSDLSQPAVVFAPHPDDETLGCGGTIVLKAMQNAPVKVAFVTDGRRAYSRFYDPESMSQMRRMEAQAAIATLGLGREDGVFLDFENGRLADCREAALAAVGELLERLRPAEVFIPYRHEPWIGTDEHRLTNEIVRSALRAHGISSTIYEYPVWFWYHWPWVPVPPTRARSRPRFLARSWLSMPRFVRDFRWAVSTEGVLEIKRAALNCHRSQMTRLVPDPQWQTLADVSGGQFISLMLQPFELFKRYPWP